MALEVANQNISMDHTCGWCEMELVSFPELGEGFSDIVKDICTLEATVPTGFETTAIEECEEKFGSKVIASRGKILFDIHVSKVPQVLQKLKSVDNVYVVMHHNINFGFENTKEKCLQQLRDYAASFSWEKGLRVWATATGHDGPLEGDFEDEDSRPKFRVTCYRNGKIHHFGSPDAACEVGGAVFNKFRWKVDMTKFNIEVVLNINDEQVYMCLALTRESLHNRTIRFLGRTTLRPTIAYGMLRMANIQPGDVICDPMCGSGTIAIEGCVNWPAATFLCGDNYNGACEKTVMNLVDLNNSFDPELKLGICKWDVCHLPLRENCIDVFVTDLPFGKRMGSKRDNRRLYPSALQTMARSCKVTTGRAVILTQDRRSMLRALQIVHPFWKTTKTFYVNIGGLLSCVYLLRRTATALVH